MVTIGRLHSSHRKCSTTISATKYKKRENMLSKENRFIIYLLSGGELSFMFMIRKFPGILITQCRQFACAVMFRAERRGLFNLKKIFFFFLKPPQYKKFLNPKGAGGVNTLIFEFSSAAY